MPRKQSPRGLLAKQAASYDKEIEGLKADLANKGTPMFTFNSPLPSSNAAPNPYIPTMVTQAEYDAALLRAQRAEDALNTMVENYDDTQEKHVETQRLLAKETAAVAEGKKEIAALKEKIKGLETHIDYIEDQNAEDGGTTTLKQQYDAAKLQADAAKSVAEASREREEAARIDAKGSRDRVEFEIAKNEDMKRALLATQARLTANENAQNELFKAQAEIRGLKMAVQKLNNDLDKGGFNFSLDAYLGKSDDNPAQKTLDEELGDTSSFDDLSDSDLKSVASDDSIASSVVTNDADVTLSAPGGSLNQPQITTKLPPIFSATDPAPWLFNAGTTQSLPTYLGQSPLPGPIPPAARRISPKRTYKRYPVSSSTSNTTGQMSSSGAPVPQTPSTQQTTSQAPSASVLPASDPSAQAPSSSNPPASDPSAQAPSTSTPPASNPSSQNPSSQGATGQDPSAHLPPATDPSLPPPGQNRPIRTPKKRTVTRKPESPPVSSQPAPTAPQAPAGVAPPPIYIACPWHWHYFWLHFFILFVFWFLKPFKVVTKIVKKAFRIAPYDNSGPAAIQVPAPVQVLAQAPTQVPAPPQVPVPPQNPLPGSTSSPASGSAPGSAPGAATGSAPESAPLPPDPFTQSTNNPTLATLPTNLPLLPDSPDARVPIPGELPPAGGDPPRGNIMYTSIAAGSGIPPTNPSSASNVTNPLTQQSNTTASLSGSSSTATQPTSSTNSTLQTPNPTTGTPAPNPALDPALDAALRPHTWTWNTIFHPDPQRLPPIKETMLGIFAHALILTSIYLGYTAYHERGLWLAANAKTRRFLLNLIYYNTREYYHGLSYLFFNTLSEDWRHRMDSLMFRYIVQGLDLEIHYQIPG